MSDASATSYDEIPYQGTAFHYTHPDAMAAVATLFGMKPPRISTSRVLELGCAEGGNLIPMALTLPEARFVGIDLSPRQVEVGRRAIAELGLTNIELRPLSILDIGDELGSFDYILCHGVYSWVPEPVRERILDVCSRNLAPHGVAYISYNTYPGWHARGMIRDMIGYHARRFSEPRVRLHQARAFLDFLVKSAVYPDTVYTRMLRIEKEMLDRSDDSYFFHEHLEEENQPIYFHEFARRLAAHDLQFLSEATFNASEANLPGETRGVLQQLSTDPIEREQYLDFLCNRTFRRSLICHRSETLNRSPEPEIMSAFHVSTRVQPNSDDPADMTSDRAVEFHSQERDVQLKTNRPLFKAALWVLYRDWPRSWPLEKLWGEVCPLLSESDGSELVEVGDPRPLAEALLRFTLSSIVELRIDLPRFAETIGERPVASPLARLLAPGPMPAVNLRHRVINTDDFEDLLLPLLDGTRDRAALVDALCEQVAAGSFSIYQSDAPVTDPATLRVAIDAMLGAALEGFRRNALLIA